MFKFESAPKTPETNRAEKGETFLQKTLRNAHEVIGGNSIIGNIASIGGMALAGYGPLMMQMQNRPEDIILPIAAGSIAMFWGGVKGLANRVEKKAESKIETNQ